MGDVFTEKAKRAGILLTGGIAEAKIVEAMCSALHEQAAEIGLEATALTQDDIKRMAFELVAFCAAVFMSQEVPKYSAQIKSWCFHRTDADAIRAFNSELLTCIERHLSEYGYPSVREKVVKVSGIRTGTPDICLEFGEPLNLAKRLARYAAERAIADYPKLFCRYVSYTVGSTLLVPMRTVASAFCASVLDVARIAGRDIFDSNKENADTEAESSAHGHNPSANQEIVFNLWYVFDDMGLVYSLRARAYVHAGSEMEKLTFLQQFAAVDFLIARPFPVPARLSSRFLDEEGGQKLPVFPMTMLETQGGPLSVGDLFREVFDRVEDDLPAQTQLTVPEAPLFCLTPLFADDAGNIYPKIDGQYHVHS